MLTNNGQMGGKKDQISQEMFAAIITGNSKYIYYF